MLWNLKEVGEPHLIEVLGADKADSGRDLGFQGAALANRSTMVLWNLKEVGEPHLLEVLGLVLPGLGSIWAGFYRE